MDDKIKGGNCDIYIDKKNKTATKKLRNTSSKERIERFKRELQIIKDLSKDSDLSICDIYDICIDEKIDKSYYKMRLYEGNLYNLFSMTKGDVKRSCELLLPIIRTLKCLEERNPPIYHRDLKPDNILFINDNGIIKLVLSDFGNAYINDNSVRLTPQEIAVGGRMFIAPEYEMGRVENVDSKGDIFSIGKILWCMVNGCPEEFLPSNFWFVDEFNLANKFKNNPDIAGLNTIIASCLNVKPECRCNYKELIELLENMIEEKMKVIDANKIMVKEFEMKRSLELQEILEKNKNLVNVFSIAYIKALQFLNNEYDKFSLINKLLEYKKESNDGVNFWSKNVIDNSAHYLYSTSYDLIYFSINYNPAKSNETYANIDISYTLKNKYSDKCIVKYADNNTILFENNNQVEIFSGDLLCKFMDNLIMHYISN